MSYQQLPELTRQPKETNTNAQGKPQQIPARSQSSSYRIAPIPQGSQVTQTETKNAPFNPLEYQKDPARAILAVLKIYARSLHTNTCTIEPADTPQKPSTKITKNCILTEKTTLLAAPPQRFQPAIDSLPSAELVGARTVNMVEEEKNKGNPSIC